MRTFEILLSIKGYPISDARKALYLRQSLNSEQFHRETLDLRNAIFEFHSKNNRQYRQFIGSRKINDWTDIPVMTKRFVQVGLSDLLSDGYNLRNVYLNSTSGSTGLPFYFAKDKFAHAMTWALIIERYSRHSIDINNSLQARFYGIPLNGKGYLQEKLKDGISNRYRFPVFDLSDKILGGYLETFSRKSFDYINGYASALVLFAKYLIKNKITLKNICPTLKICITTSEICDHIDHAILEKAFGIKVVNEYGAAELDLIAFEDESSDWIMSDENLFFEIVDENNKPVLNGSEGKLLVTSLYNKAMPFIRYELGDIVTISGSKKGNNSILENLTGRTNDIIVLPGGRKAAGLTFYYISKRLLEKEALLKEFVIKQTAPEKFLFEYVSANELSIVNLNLIRDTIDKYLEPGLEIYFKKVEHIDRTHAGKLKHFQRLF